ncbi:MAG: amidohydrolase family protein [Bacteroidales bacterium]|nr:amidohydrolase family protein [Bacteroidales bacterium]
MDNQIRRISAHYIFTNIDNPIKNGIVSVLNDGTIVNIEKSNKETANTEFYNGVIVPGFVNAHCHLELSHMKGILKPGKHLIDFLLGINNLRTDISYKSEPAINADRQMFIDGISVVGDISNRTDCGSIKNNSKIFYKNFIELIGTSNQRIVKNIDTYNNIKVEYNKLGISENDIIAVPHAPYSVSPMMFETINQLNKNKNIISIHNQETEAENELYISGKGDMKEKFPTAGIDVSLIPTTGKSSLQSYGKYLREYENVLLIHNTFTKQDDIDYAKNNFKNPYFVLCPNSNLNLEHCLPNVKCFIKNNLNICIGTDSLSSNNQLSIIEELKTLRVNFPDIDFETLLKMATINGAKALQVNNNFGKIEIGKKPGIVLIEKFDFENMNISVNSKAKRII